MVNTYHTNQKVKWPWGKGYAEGFIRNVYREKVTLTIKNSRITREASDDNPAYKIEQSDGDEVLKLHSELQTCD